MKKLILIAALLATATSYAATNKFTFRVNSSGANMYVCGFHIDNKDAFEADGNAVSGSYAVWKEQLMDEWTGQAYNNSPVEEYNTLSLTNMNEELNFTRDYSYQKIGTDNVFKEIKDLTIFLSDEKFGASYYVDVCYNVPLFMDLNEVQFNIKNSISYTMLNGRDYLSKANIVSGVINFPIDVAIGENYSKILNAGFSAPYKEGRMEGSGELDLSFIGPKDTNEYVIVSRYQFKENSTERRPHVAHGGTFVLDTIVTPVSSQQ